MTTQEARDRVARGATYLDLVRPGWAARIDVGTLTLHDACGCIVGQLCETADYSVARHSIGLSMERGVHCGFDVFRGFESDVAEDFALLQDAWLIAIADRVLPSPALSMPTSETVRV
jgi:hypothetical protein